MNTLKIVPELTKLHYPLATANVLLLPEALQKQPTQSAYVIAHEARNPLTSINLAIGMLQSEPMSITAKICLDIITSNSTRISNMMNEIIQLQEADDEASEKYSIYKALDDLIEMASNQMIPKKIRIKKEYDRQDCTIKIILDKALH